MKKLFSVLLCLCFALCVTACKKQQPQPTPTPDFSPLPTPPAQEQPEEEKVDKSQLDPFEIEAVCLAETLVKSIEEIEKGKPDFEIESFMLLLALVDNEDFTYYGYAPRLADGSLEFFPARCEIIAKQIFGKDIPASELMDDDFYNKSRDSYLVPDGIGCTVKYMAQNAVYTPQNGGNSCYVTFDLMEEKSVDGDPAFVNVGKGKISFVLSSEKGGAYWTYSGFTLL